jgi:hypothetical protein
VRKRPMWRKFKFENLARGKHVGVSLFIKVVIFYIAKFSLVKALGFYMITYTQYSKDKHEIMKCTLLKT